MRSFTHFVPRTLLTNGKDLLALRLHSMTLRLASFSSPSAGFLMICILKGPEILKALATFWAMTFNLARSFGSNENGGRTKVASPEWTPAFSTCSETAWINSFPSWATASISISWALSMNWGMKVKAKREWARSVILKKEEKRTITTKTHLG